MVAFALKFQIESSIVQKYVMRIMLSNHLNSNNGKMCIPEWIKTDIDDVLLRAESHYFHIKTVTIIWCSCVLNKNSPFAHVLTKAITEQIFYFPILSVCLSICFGLDKIKFYTLKWSILPSTSTLCQNNYDFCFAAIFELFVLLLSSLIAM